MAAIPVGLAGAYAVLAIALPSNVPAPALSPLVHLDEKLRFIREHPELDPTILAVGSSITWRQAMGSELAAAAGESERFLNGGTAHLQISQTWSLAKFYLDHYANVETLLVLTSLPDFDDCPPGGAEVVDPHDAGAYAFGGWPTAYFYFRYFSPQRYARAALTLAERRAPLTGDLYLDEYGAGPVKLPAGTDLGLRYDDINSDPACLDALRAFLSDMSARDIRLVLVFAPVNPLYLRAYPDAARELEAIVARVREDLPPNVRLVLLHDDPGFAAQDFYDAFHLELSGARRLSALIARVIEREDAPQILDGRAIRCLDGKSACTVAAPSDQRGTLTRGGERPGPGRLLPIELETFKKTH